MIVCKCIRLFGVYLDGPVVAWFGLVDLEW